MINEIWQGDVLELAKRLPDNSIHMICTSPPYWGLRDYGTALWVGGSSECDHKILSDNSKAALTSTLGGSKRNVGNALSGFKTTCKKCGATRIDQQLGLEKTPEEYIEKMVLIFRELRRALREDGTLWLNLGDGYAQGNGKKYDEAESLEDAERAKDKGYSTQAYAGYKGWQRASGTAVSGLKPKDLIGMPWRIALALQADGWYLRSDIIWCLSGGTWLYAKTQKGEMPMMVRDLARLDPKTVKLWNGQKWTQVLGWSKTSRNSTELEIVLRSGERISCTPTHKFPTNRGLLSANELRIGDILQSVQLPEPEAQYNPPAITNLAAWFIGLYLAEGSRSGDTIQIAGHAKELDRLERVQQIAQYYGGSVTYTLNGNKLDIRVYGRFLNTLVDQYISGKTAKNKCLKVRCWSHNNQWLTSLLDGYLAADAHWDEPNKRWRLGFTRNYNLERDLRVLSARLGFKLVLKPAFAELNGKRYSTFKGEIRFETSNHLNNKSQTEIVEIRKARCREVYDIGVADEPHLFALASGVLTHNSKPNPMPESVTDRPTKAHEYLFLLTKSARYFYDAEAIKEAAEYKENRATFRGGGIYTNNNSFTNGTKQKTDGEIRPRPETNNRNRRTVWTIATEAYPEAHFATYPEALVEPCILAGTSAMGVCSECGKGWERVVSKEREYDHVTTKAGKSKNGPYAIQTGNGAGTHDIRHGVYSKTNTTGWQPTCNHTEQPIPAIVLDPFLGSGTTASVAKRLGRNWLGFELNPDYIKLAWKRIDQTQPPLIVENDIVISQEQQFEQLSF